jgi:proliferating cell nuclear antigen
MFNAIATKSELESFIDPISTLVDECKLHLDEDALTARAVDPANVGMVDADLEASGFESYEADGGVIGVNLSRLEDVVGFADSGDLIHLELDEETRKLHIEIEGLNYTLALIDPDSIRQEPDLPDLDLPATIVLEGRRLNRGIKAADMVSDHITFAVEENADFPDLFVIEAEGDTDDVRVELEEEDVIDLTPGAAHSLYSLDYMKDLNKAINAGDEVSVELGKEFPINLFFDIAEGNGSVRFMLAPRIQS